MRACRQCMERKMGCEFLHAIHDSWDGHSVDGKCAVDIKDGMLKLDCSPLRNFYTYHICVQSMALKKPLTIYNRSVRSYQLYSIRRASSPKVFFFLEYTLKSARRQELESEVSLDVHCYDFV